MKKILALLFCPFLAFAAAPSFNTPINRGILLTPLNANGYRITNAANPVAAQDLATKNYVDTNSAAASGLATNAINATNLFGVVYNGGATNLMSTNTVLKGTTEFRTPDGNDVITADFINDVDNHLLSFDFSPGSGVLIGGTGVVAAAFYGDGSGLTGINTAQNLNVRNIKNSDSAVGNGSTDDRAALLAADTAVSATNGTVYLPPGTYRIASNLTTTNTFWFGSGAKVTVDSGATWWHRGKLVASPEQHIFDGAGTVSFATNHQMGTIWFDWFGANQGVTTINEATNCAWAIQRGLNAARTKVSEYYALTDTQPNGVWQNTWAHYPGYRQCAFRPGGLYLLTTNLVMQESYFSDIQGNHATLYALFPFTTNAVWECNDVRMGLFENLVIKTYRESNVFAGFRFNNIATVETGVTPFNSTFRKVQVLGHLKGFQFGWFIGDGIDANNERFTFDTCVAMDYERSGWLFKNSQAFDHVLINCTASGGGYGWFGVSCFDPTWAPSGSGSYHLFSGGGGANIISDFVANSFRPTSVYGWDSESSRRLYTDPFFPVPTNSFAYDTGGTNFYGTNTLVAGFVSGNTNWVTTAYTNDYTTDANKWVWEYLVSTGGVHRVAVTAGQRPFNPSFPLDGVTSFNIVLVGPNGITNYHKTWGALGSSAATRTQKITVNGFNFSSDIMPWDGTGVLLASPRPTEFIGRWRTVTNHVKFGMYTSTAGGDDGSIDFHGSTFNVQQAATSPPSDADRVLLFRSDGSLDTNNVNGNFVSIIGGNNIHASVPENVTSNLLGRMFQRSEFEVAGAGSFFKAPFMVGGTNYTDRVEATNSSSLILSGGGQNLEIGSGAANFAGGSGFTGIGANLTYTGSGNDGNLATTVDSLQELNDAMDNLASGQISQAITQGHTANIIISNATTAFRGNVGIGTNTPSVPLEIFKASPSANEVLLRLSTSDDASRFSVDEDGDASFDGAVAVGTTITAGSSITAAGGSIIANSGRVYRSSPADGTVAWSWNNGTRIMMNTNGLLCVPGSLVVSSNSWTNVITLANGENRFASSNGIPFVIFKDAAGTLATNYIGGSSGGSGNGAWRTNALAGVSQPNLSPYDPATAVIVIPQDAHFLASNGVSSRIFYPNGNAFAEFPLDSGFELNEPGGQTAIKVASSAAGGYSLIDTNNNPVLNWENGVQIPLATTTTMVVTNIVSPFGQLLSTGNATNYTIDFNTADKQSITATGNVAFLTINNISNGAMKRFYITNVFKATSNINVLMPTNCLVVTTNSGGPAALDTVGTNWVMTITNDAKLSMECHADSMRGLAWYLRLLQP